MSYSRELKKTNIKISKKETESKRAYRKCFKPLSDILVLNFVRILILPVVDFFYVPNAMMATQNYPRKPFLVFDIVKIH